MAPKRKTKKKGGSKKRGTKRASRRTSTAVSMGPAPMPAPGPTTVRRHSNTKMFLFFAIVIAIVLVVVFGIGAAGGMGGVLTTTSAPETGMMGDMAGGIGTVGKVFIGIITGGVVAAILWQFVIPEGWKTEVTTRMGAAGSWAAETWPGRQIGRMSLRRRGGEAWAGAKSKFPRWGRQTGDEDRDAD